MKIVKFQWDLEILKELKLHEYSFTAFPMNPKARVSGIKFNYDILDRGDEKGLIHLPEMSVTPRELEDFLRDSGMSKSDATKLASLADASRRDSDVDDLKALTGLTGLFTK